MTFDPGGVLVIYAISISLGTLLVVGLDQYIDLEQSLGLDLWRCFDTEAGPAVRPTRAAQIENPVVCPGCRAVSEHEYSHCWACGSELPQSRFSMIR